MPTRKESHEYSKSIWGKSAMPTQEQTQTGTPEQIEVMAKALYERWAKINRNERSWNEVASMWRMEAAAYRSMAEVALAALHTQTTAQAGVIGKLVEALENAKSFIEETANGTDRRIMVDDIDAALLLAQKEQ